MRFKILQEQDGQRSYALVLDKGEEFTAALTQAAREQGLSASGLTAIGGFSEVTLGFFDRERMEYRKIPVNEQVEVLALLGNITLEEDGEPRVHAHAVVGLPDGTTRGGHVLEARTWPTLEVLVTEQPSHLLRRTDPKTGLALLHVED